MIRSLRWYPFEAIGSFVAQDLETVLVAPMNADGTRSTYEGEIVALEADSREADPALDAQVRRWLEVGRIADAFRSVLRSWLTEAQLIEVQMRNNREPEGSAVCHTHDFCDANMAMLEAFETATKRPLFVDGVIPDESSDLFNDAWNLAKAEGFATWTAEPKDLEKLEQIAANADLGVAHEADAEWLRRFVDRFTSTARPAPYDPSEDADRKK